METQEPPQVNPQTPETPQVSEFASFVKTLRAWSTKNYLIVFLVVMIAYSLYASKKFEAIPLLLVSVGVAAAEDMLIAFGKGEKFYLPTSAIVTGLFVGILLPTSAPLYIAAAVAFVAIISKHFIKIQGRHIFNPAAFGATLAVFAFSNVFHAWWAATSLPLIILFGIFIAWKQKRYTLTPVYLVTYALVSIIILTITGGPIRFYPDIIDESLLFFAFFMLIEPVTAAVSENSRAAQGAIAAIAAVLLLNFAPLKALAAVNVLLGLLIADLFVPLLNRHIR